jgi:hypothetical protein
MSLWGWEQQINTLPSAGGSTGSGRQLVVPPRPVSNFALDRFDNALPQVPRQRCRHDEPPTHQRLVAISRSDRATSRERGSRG